MLTNRLTRRILVPLDGSNLGACIYPHLRALACVESQILLLGIVNEPLPMIDLPPLPAYASARRREIEEYRAYLRAVAQTLHDVTPHLTMLVTAGTPADEILRVAQKQAVDLILMPTHGRGTMEQLVLGSVSNHVVRASPIPVMLVREQHDASAPDFDACAVYRRVMVPLDGSERARAALPVAVALARTLNATVHLVRAVPTREEFFDARERTRAATPCPVHTDAGASQARRDAAYYEDSCTALADSLDAEADRLRPAGVSASSELLLGKPVPSILSAVDPGDVIVLTSHGTGGVRHWPMDSVAEQLVAAAASPVVLVPVAERRGHDAHASALGPSLEPIESVTHGLVPERRLASGASARR